MASGEGHHERDADPDDGVRADAPVPPPTRPANSPSAPSDAAAGRREEPPSPTRSEEDGPPPPPAAALRAEPTAGGDPSPPSGGARSRWRLVLLVVGVLAVVAVPVALAILAGTSTPTEEDGAGAGTVGTGDDAPEDGEPRPPDLERLSGRDAVLGGLLEHVDDSERAMISFQDRVREIVAEAGAGEVERLRAEIRDAAEAGAGALSEIRPELVEPVGEPAVEEVRTSYLVHHDAWADYLDALAEDPAMLGGGQQDARWRLSINASADTFARTLREELDDGLDGEVRDYALAILERGFERDDVRPDV